LVQEKSVTLARIAWLSIIIATGISVIAIVGWASNWLIVAQISPQFIPMPPSTALMFLLLCASCFAYYDKPSSPRRRMLAEACALIVLVFCLIVLIEFLIGIPLDIEQLFLRTVSRFGSVPIGRMSPITAAGLVLVSASLVISSSASGDRRRQLAAILVLLAASIGFVIILGYLFGAPLLYGSSIMPVALTTAIALDFLGIGVCASAGPTCWPIRIVIGPSLNAQLLRGFLPLTIAIVLFLGWFYVVGVSWIGNPALTASLALFFALITVITIASRVARRVGEEIDETHDALRESEQRFRQITENMLDVIAQTDLLGTCEYASPSMKTVLGYDPKDMLGKSMFEYVHPDDFDNVLEIVRKALAAGTTEKFEYRYRHADGHYVWLESGGNPLFDEKGQMIGAVLSSRDITERKQMEDAVRNSEIKYRTLFEKIPQGIYQTSLEGKLMTANPALVRLLGYDSEKELLAVNVERDLYMNSEDRKTWMETIRTRGEVRNAELVLKCKDGEELTVLDNAHVVHDEHANPVYYEGTLTDITERKRIEWALRERMKELNCLYGIARSVERPDSSLDAIMGEVVSIIPPAYAYPDIACARIVLGNQIFESAGFKESRWSQSADIKVLGKNAGTVEVYYLEEKPTSFEGPFLKEERGLIDTIAERLARVVERKRVQDALHESEERFQLAINATKDGLWEWDTQTNQEFFSPRWCEIIGYSFDDPELPHTYQSWASRIHPDDYDRVISAMNNHLEKGTRYDVDYRHLHKSGEYRWQNSKGQAVLNESGKPIKMVGCISDITERKRMEQAQASLVTILEETPDFVGFADAKDTHILYVNRAGRRMTGILEEEDVTKLKITDVHPDWTNKLFADEIIPTAIRDGIWRGECAFLNRDGREVPVLMVLLAHRNPSGEVERFSTISRDITERKQMERMKDQFVSMVSHELRTPLTSIRASLGLLASGVIGALPEKGQRMLEIAVTNTDRLVRLINDILDTERLASGKTPMEKKQCSTAQLVKQAADVMKPMAEKAGVYLSVESQDAALWADPDRIVQALTNLISNAIKFSPKGGKIWLTAEHKEDRMLFRVQDEGRGIPPDKLGMLFERFQQVDSSDAREKGGSGLGLSISRSIIEQHNGKIWVESTVGKGSTFFFTIPLLQEAQAPLQPEATTGTQSARRVLIIEDDPDLANILATMLQRHDIHPYLAHTGEKGIVLSKQMHPDLIVLDLILPDIDGSIVVETLRKDNILRSVPLVVYTVRELDKQQRENLRLGETLFFTKSRIPPEQFEEKVIQFMKRIFDKGGGTGAN